MKIRSIDEHINFIFALKIIRHEREKRVFYSLFFWISSKYLGDSVLYEASLAKRVCLMLMISLSVLLFFIVFTNIFYFCYLKGIITVQTQFKINPSSFLMFIGLKLINKTNYFVYFLLFVNPSL